MARKGIAKYILGLSVFATCYSVVINKYSKAVKIKFKDLHNI